MKPISDKSTQTLCRILDLKKSKIDNTKGTFKPLHVEIIDQSKDWRVISLAHYGEQNGDLMSDPEMLFLHDRKTDNFYPYYYRNDYIGMETQSMTYEENKVFMRNPMLQSDQTRFANIWLNTIAEQQNI